MSLLLVKYMPWFPWLHQLMMVCDVTMETQQCWTTPIQCRARPTSQVNLKFIIDMIFVVVNVDYGGCVFLWNVDIYQQVQTASKRRRPPDRGHKSICHESNCHCPPLSLALYWAVWVNTKMNKTRLIIRVIWYIFYLLLDYVIVSWSQWPRRCWDRGFESRSVHEYLFVVFVCYVVLCR
jgi:hypothetical protein